MTTITDELKRKWDRPSPEASPVFKSSLGKRLLTNECSKRLRHLKFHERASGTPNWG
jgi:hypothetical protein